VVKVTYIEASGKEHVLDVKPGFSLMEGATQNGVPGIVADCGGECACGTCRIFVDEAWREKTGKASDMEEAMLELHEDVVPGQRLSCQIKLTEELDGLVVHLPESQF
jgi:2Fe-2S ferredoxin